MKVLKHPNPHTLYVALHAIPKDDVRDWFEMTESELDDWAKVEIAAGWKPAAEPAPEESIPAAVTPWQMRRALNQLGLRATVEAAVAAADQDTKDGWDYALEIRRDNPLIAGMGAALGMTDAQLDDLFRLAATFA